MDRNLKFHDHVALVISKANRLLAIVRKSFHFSDNQIFLTLYRSIIRQVIEYGNTIWGRYYIVDQHDTPCLECLRTHTHTGTHFNSLNNLHRGTHFISFWLVKRLEKRYQTHTHSQHTHTHTHTHPYRTYITH